MTTTQKTTKTATPCDYARKHFTPRACFPLAEFEMHARTCAQCSKHQRALKRAQRSRTSYSRAYPLTGDPHKYLLIAPREMWTRAQRRADESAISMRFVLNALLDHYAAHGMPAGVTLPAAKPKP